MEDNDQQVLLEAILGATVDHQAKIKAEGSFSERNPHLGKMIKCKLCARRHRQSESCNARNTTPEFIKENE